MPWFWTDDLARLLAERGEVDASRTRRWSERPVAVSGADALATARQLLAAVDDEEDEPPSPRAA